MNNTKWEEIRLAMCEYPKTVMWRIKNINNAFISAWDGEWYYHFQEGGYDTIEWLEVKFDNELMKKDIVSILQKIHVAGEVLKDSIKVYGYVNDKYIDYI
jgi:hypothetical protein